MNSLHIAKFLHLICVSGFFGVNLINYNLIAKANRAQNYSRLRYSLKASLIADFLMPILIIGLFITGTLLVSENSFPYTTPWIETAYGIFALSLCLWLTLVMLKLHNFRRLSQHHSVTFNYLILYRVLNWLLFILLILAVHDAVIRGTFL